MNTYLCTWLGAIFAALVSTAVVIYLARRLKLYDRPGVRKVHGAPVPRLGGLAIAAAALGMIACVFALDNASLEPGSYSALLYSDQSDANRNCMDCRSATQLPEAHSNADPQTENAADAETFLRSSGQGDVASMKGCSGADLWRFGNDAARWEGFPAGVPTRESTTIMLLAE